MRAVTYAQTGGPEVLELSDLPDPDPGPGEVVVEVHRSGVNPTDWKSRQGGGAGEPVDPPQTPGQDGAGIVRAVGNGVDPSLVGLRVWTWEAAYQRPRGGTAQELAVLPARQVSTLPDSASFDLGASLGVPFVTAHRCLTVAEDGPTRLGPGAAGADRPRAGRRRRGRQRRHPARAVGRRARDRHRQRAAQGAARGRGRR